MVIDNKFPDKCKILIQGNEYLHVVIFARKNISPSGKYISFGGYFADEISGTYPIEDIELLEILEILLEEGL